MRLPVFLQIFRKVFYFHTMNDSVFSLLPDELKVDIKTGNPQQQLLDKILLLWRSHPHKLASLLYQIDVNEQQVNAAFRLNNDVEIAQAIMHLIVQRLQLKINLRNTYSK